MNLNHRSLDNLHGIHLHSINGPKHAVLIFCRDCHGFRRHVIEGYSSFIVSLRQAVAKKEPRCQTVEERLDADCGGTGVNIGKHPMAHRRAEMDALGITPAANLIRVPSGKPVRIAGCVIVRQRPQTAKGIVFLSVEDETGIANVVVMPDMFDTHRLAIVSNRWLLIEGPIQNVDNVIHVRAKMIEPLGLAMDFAGAAVASHDFH